MALHTELSIHKVAFGLPPTMSPEVKRADLVLLATERRDLMPADTTPWPILEGIQPLHGRIYGMAPPKAQAAFLRRYVELTGQRRAA